MELSSYKLDYMEDFFRNRPTLTPHEENLEFFYYPWTFKSVLIDELEPIPNKELFTICCFLGLYSSAFIEIFKRMNIKKVYSPHVEIGKEFVEGIEFIPFQHILPNEITPVITNKEYKFSFVGTLETHPCRLLMYNLFKNHEDFKFVIREHFHMDVRNETQNTTEIVEYQTIMKQSKYTLCPRGRGVGSIRYWEAIKYGSIPIVISDNLLLPTDHRDSISVKETEMPMLLQID